MGRISLEIKYKEIVEGPKTPTWIPLQGRGTLDDACKISIHHFQ